MMQEKISWAVQNISASYYPIIRKYLPCARRLQCRQRECGQIRRHPAFYRDTELRQKVLSYMEEFGSAVSNTVSSVSDQLSSIFNLTGSARDEANQMLADFFSSKNISKDALDILTTILKLKNMISSQSSTGTASMAQNTDNSSYTAENTSDDSSDRIACRFF